MFFHKSNIQGWLRESFILLNESDVNFKTGIQFFGEGN
jgi:hypothetical protein